MYAIWSTFTLHAARSSLICTIGAERDVVVVDCPLILPARVGAAVGSLKRASFILLEMLRSYPVGFWRGLVDEVPIGGEHEVVLGELALVNALQQDRKSTRLNYSQ